MTKYTVKVDDVNGCVDVIADPGNEGVRRTILAAHGDLEQAEPLARRVAAMLKAHDTRAAFEAGRINSMCGPDPRDLAGVVGDEQGGDRTDLERGAARAEKAADQWDAHVKTLITLLTPPELPALVAFDPQIGKSSRMHDTIPRPVHHIDADDEHEVERLVGTAMVNAYTYRKYATDVRAYVADRWGYEADPDAFPHEETDVLP